MSKSSKKEGKEIVCDTVCEEKPVEENKLSNESEKSLEKSKASQKEEPEEKKVEMKIKDIPGVGAVTAEKLESVGYTDLMSIAVATPGELMDATGINDAAAKKIIAVARNNLDMGFESGEQLLKRREKIFRISTGSTAFDEMLAGGIESGAITETYAQYGGGKTQIALILAVNLQLKYPDAVAVYIDSEGSFRPERIIQLAKGVGLDPDKVLKNIKVARAFNSDHQMLLAEKVEDLIKKDNTNVKLVIVDSLTSHFRAEFVGRGTLANRQQQINKHMHVLAKLAHLYNVVVYVTNQVMTKPDQFFGDPTEAIGGNIVGHNSTFRIYLRKGKKGSRVAKLVDSPNLPDQECGFYVTEEGLKDL